GQRQVLHGLVDAAELPPGDGQIAGLGGSAGEYHRVELLTQLRSGDVGADVDSGAELGPLGLHLFDTTVDEALLHLELGDAVAQKSPDAVGPLEHDNLVAGAGEL